MNLTPLFYPDYYYFPYIKTDYELICEIMSQHSYDISRETVIIRNIEIVLETFIKFF